MSQRRNDMQMQMDDDDNYSQSSQQSDTSSIDLEDTTTAINPLDSAIEDLEGRIISALDNFRLHPGVRSDPSSESIHSELKDVLRPILEIAAHVGPNTARSQWRAASRATLDIAIEEVHTKINSDLIFPVLLESVQSDVIPAKRAAALGFFHNLHQEYKLPGSYLDYIEGTSTGRYAGSLYGPFENTRHAPPSRMVLKQRTAQKAQKIGLLLRYWIEGATACTVLGAFTDVRADGAIASRAVISSSAAIRPALRHVAEKISSADDTGALKLFIPVMRMIGGVLKRFFSAIGNDGAQLSPGELQSMGSLKSACVKFLEIVVLSFSSRAQPGGSASSRRRQNVSSEDFALEDLPQGHPIITRQALEEIGEDAFTVLRGLTMIGGQVKVESGMISDVRLSLGLDATGQGTSPSSEIVGILRPAALSYLEIESSLGTQTTEETPFPTLDRSEIETDFNLNQKSYALTINAVSMLATNRPTFFGDSASCLARRAIDPPTVETSTLIKAATMSVKSHLRASCLTLLRNALSVTSGSSDTLHKALSSDICGMKIQADKALRMAEQAASLKTAGRAARNRAAVFYQWEGGATSEMDTVGSKRKRAGENKLEQMRAAKAARGLGGGIQLPKNMPDACELILINLANIPSSRAAAIVGDKKSKVQHEKRSRPFTFDYFVDAIMTNGASLASNENRWYGRDGGDAWVMDISTLVSEDEAEEDDEDEVMTAKSRKKSLVPVTFSLDVKTGNAASAAKKGESNDDVKLFRDQCQVAAADAFERILKRSRHVRDPSVADFGNQIAAKMAWSLNSIKPLRGLKESGDLAVEGITTASKKREKTGEEMKTFANKFPLVASCIQFDVDMNAQTDSVTSESNVLNPSSSLVQRILNEAFILEDVKASKSSEGKVDNKLYENTLDLYIAAVLQACDKADEKPMDNNRKKIASAAASSLSKDLSLLPSVSENSLELASLLCDIDGITKKAIEASRKASNKTVATASATNAAKAAAEKRAKAALLVLRDAAFQRSKIGVRKNAVNCAVGIASGRLPASQAVEEMALKLVMNVLYPKANDLADQVVASAVRELDRAAKYAIDNNQKIKQANEEATASRPADHRPNLQLPQSDVEKNALDYVKKPANLFMALCIRRPGIIRDLMSSCKEGAEVLAKAIRGNMPKLARAAAKKYGAAKIAAQVAGLADESETGLLMSFLDNLVPVTGAAPTQELIDACIRIQDARLIEGERDPRFIIPVLSGMKRTELETRLPSLVSAEDNVFKASLHRMSERLKRQAMSSREEVEEEPLLGMTLCEQVVYLHKLDFAAANIPQKRYLHAIRLCLDNDEIYTDRVIMAALDYISNSCLNGQLETLPLAYMRTIILTCSKHETLHSWICHILLPRLVECQIYNDRRQWEGWMRCAKMLEHGDGGVSSVEAINQLPEEQYNIYRNKFPKA